MVVNILGSKRPALPQTNLPQPKDQEPVEYVMSRVIPGSPVLRASKKIVPANFVKYICKLN